MAKRNQLKENPIIWKDRRRRMGLPLSFNRYYIKNKRLYLNQGFFSTTENELLMYRVLDMKLKRTFWDKLCGVGTLTLFTADETHKELELKKIKKSSDVRDLISQIVEEERHKLKIAGKEMYGVSDNLEFGDIDGEDGLFE